ncbi:MAG TPA: glycosyltransferase family 4 protein [Mycobacterium sp.]|nr:glycosyltransferase family 4 protein [Mycobacterium sp.]
MDGGGKRVAAFRRALDYVGGVRVVAVGPQGPEADARVLHSPIHRVKRRLLPVPLRGPAQRTLGKPQCAGPTLSLVPSAHDWSLRSGPTWLDFADLWSDIARNHARTVDPISGSFNRAQARVWARREAKEAGNSQVASVASYADRDHLGGDTIWLPTPVAERFNTEPRPSARGVRTCGLLANFDYPPNRDAYRRLVTEWLPVLSRTFERVVVAGFGSDGLPRSPHVEILGPIASVTSFYQNVDAVIAPMERGGGMKVKVVEAMMHGVPVIATDHAAEGLPPAISAACSPLRGDWQLDRDPREDAGVVDELQHFTFENFLRQFRMHWFDRMVNFNG